MLAHSTPSLTVHSPYLPLPLSHFHFAKLNFWLKPIFRRNEVTQISFARSLHQRTITKDWVENLAQSQIRVCANENEVLVTTMLSLKGSTVTVNGPVLFSTPSSSPRQTQRLQGEIWPCFPRAFVFFAIWSGQWGFWKWRHNTRKQWRSLTTTMWNAIHCFLLFSFAPMW